MQIIKYLMISICLMMISKVSADEANKNLRAYKCKVEYAEVWDVEIINAGSDFHFNSEGEVMESLRHGMAELFFADEEILLDRSTNDAISDTLNDIDKWKSATVTPSRNPVVGLHIKRTDFLILNRNSWVLIRFSNFGQTILQVFEARPMIDRGKFKVFTRVPSKEPVLSEDKKITDIFWKLATSSKDTSKEDQIRDKTAPSK